jgi:transcriptional regulator with XRE-family HTH domain
MLTYNRDIASENISHIGGDKVKELRNLRLQAGETQNGLAKKLGVDRSAVGHWESGAAKPASDKIPAIAAALGCTIDELYGKEG